MKFLLTILLLPACFLSQAQTFDIKIFEGKRGRVTEQVKRNKATYKRIRREQKAYIKEQKRAYKASKDSLNAASLKNMKDKVANDSIAKLKGMQKRYYIYTDTLYTLEEISAWDADQANEKQKRMEYAERRLSGNYYFNKYMGYNNEIKRHQQEYKVYKDSLKQVGIEKEERDYLLEVKKNELSTKYNKTVEDRTKKELAQRNLMPVHETSAEMAELQKYGNLASGFNPEEANTFGLEDGESVDKATTQGLKYFEGNEDVLQDAMGHMQKLKKKYSSVPNSNDLSTATKRSSLKDKPLRERLVFGGTFQIHIDQSTSVDLNPELAYLINKNFSVGVGGNYRFNAETVDISNQTLKSSIYGYRIFAEHRILRSFFAHVEYESLAISTSQEQSKEWYHSLLAGLEKRILVSNKLEGQVAVLYNFMYNGHPGYGSPWVLRVGFNFLSGTKKDK